MAQGSFHSDLDLGRETWMGTDADAPIHEAYSLAPPELTLYARVADSIARDIREGLYAPGDRLPSVRELTRRLGVSTSTVVEAFGRLIDRGLVLSRPQAGFFVRPETTVLQTPAMSTPRVVPTTVSTGDIAMGVVQATAERDLVAFGSALPNVELQAPRAVRRLLAQAARSPRCLAYAPPPGLKELRVQIARRAMDSGCEVSADDVVVTSGCQEAVVLSLRSIANPGDTIAVESPTFYGTLQAIQSLGLRALEIPTHPETGIHLEALEMAIEQFAVKGCVVTPAASNPLGTTMADERKVALLQILESRDVPLIEEDIHGDLVFGATRPRAIKSWDGRGQVLLCSSVSKSIAPGLRVGWVLGGRYTQRLSYMKLVSSMASATLPQVAVAEYLSAGDYDRHLRAARTFYSQSRDQLLQLVAQHFPSETKVTRPSGGFVAWLELPRGADAVDLYRRALAEGVSVAPGPLFSARAKYRSFLRLNYAAAWDDRTRGAVQRLGQLASVEAC